MQEINFPLEIWYETDYVHGKRRGKCIEYYKSGKVRNVLHYLNNTYIA
ncbi:hypothetical protein D5b_00006 [Faustovirus]|nr:hypothetical protein D5b_00006 [Faustovirus]AMN84902.1 hypothetical protein D6_00504 [Faustovirus]AMP43967.1 hypothetical protein PRJ_Dakar_00006 [Faustovirus]